MLLCYNNTYFLSGYTRGLTTSTNIQRIAAYEFSGKAKLQEQVPIDSKLERYSSKTIDAPLLTSFDEKLSMSSSGDIQLLESAKETSSAPLLGKRPERPEAPKHDHVHEMGCQDKCRPNILGHAYHWSELLCLVFLITCGILGFLKENGNLHQFKTYVFWIICAAICFIGNIFLWNIGWVETDAEYSRRIANFCEDIEQETDDMAENVNTLVGVVKENEILATKAAKQTAKMAKQCGVLDASGNVVLKNLKQIENALNSPTASRYNTRQEKISKVMRQVNFQSKRDNAYHDLINIFKVTARNSNSDSSYFKVTDKKRLSKMKKETEKYNKISASFESDKIDLEEFARADADGDGKIGLFEFCEHIYHKVIQRELGAEPRKVFDMQAEIEKAKARIAEIDRVQAGEQQVEEMEDFEINQECVAFAAPPSS